MDVSERAPVQIVKQIYDAFARRDMRTAFGLFSPSIEIVQSTELPWGGHYRGMDEAKVFFRTLTQRITSTLVLERFVDAGDCVVAIGRTQGTVNDGGRPYDVPVAHVWLIQGGVAVRVQYYIDNPTMLAALA